MTEREQMQRVCQWNRELVGENSRLHEEMVHLRKGWDELHDANENLRVERDAADVLLGAAMDEVLRARKL
jgi:hypothetical protein